MVDIANHDDEENIASAMKIPHVLPLVFLQESDDPKSASVSSQAVVSYIFPNGKSTRTTDL